MFSTKYTFVIFDFHGTLTDNQLRTIKAYHQAGVKVLGQKFNEAFFMDVLTRPAHQQRDQIGVTHTEFIEKMLRQYKFSDLPGYPDQLTEKFLEVFHAVMDETYISIPGIRQVINKLHSENIEMAISTNKTDKVKIREILNLWHFPYLADRVFNQLDSKRKKPHPDAIGFIFQEMAARGIAIERKKSLFVGDYITDIQASHQFGIDSVLIAAGSSGLKFRLKDPLPTFVITEPLELFPIIEGKKAPEINREIELKPSLWKNRNWTSKER